MRTRSGKGKPQKAERFCNNPRLNKKACGLYFIMLSTSDLGTRGVGMCIDKIISIVIGQKGRGFHLDRYTNS